MTVPFEFGGGIFADQLSVLPLNQSPYPNRQVSKNEPLDGSQALRGIGFPEQSVADHVMSIL